MRRTHRNSKDGLTIRYDRMCFPCKVVYIWRNKPEPDNARCPNCGHRLENYQVKSETPRDLPLRLDVDNS